MWEDKSIFCNANTLKDKDVHSDLFEPSDWLISMTDTKKKELLTSEVFKKAKFGFRNAQTISLHQTKHKSVREVIHVTYIKQVKFQLLQSFYVRLC